MSAFESIGVVLLLAVVRQRLPGHLSARDSAAVGKRRQEESIDRRRMLQDIEHLLDAFVSEGDRADLNADCPARRCLLRVYTGRKCASHRSLQKRSSIHE